MPLKQAARERAWGTRYDTLESSPTSPPTLRRPSPNPISHSPNTPAATATPPSRKDGIHGSPSASADTASHDASIFIGSLPTNMEHMELTQRLTEHFAPYPEAKAIKVVRDSRGGICGFIQCEGAAAAGDLLRNLATNPPRPFYGRFLRFEAAKAFRTLLISYRIPPGSMVGAPHDPFDSPTSQRSRVTRQSRAIRIFRPRNSRNLGILYDLEALNFDNSMAAEAQDANDNPFSGAGLLLHPFEYDAKSIRRLVTAFGPIETFEIYSPDPNGTDFSTQPVGRAPTSVTADPCQESSIASPLGYPHPDEAPRSVEMSKEVWRAKWLHRDDSVCALLTLRRIPHLVVSWAHHQHPSSTNATPLHRGERSSSTGFWGSPTPRTNSENSPLVCFPQDAGSPSAPINLQSSTRSAGPSSTSNDSPARPTVLLTGSTGRWADQVTELDVYGMGSPLSAPSLPASPVGATNMCGSPTSVGGHSSSGAHKHIREENRVDVPLRLGQPIPETDRRANHRTADTSVDRSQRAAAPSHHQRPIPLARQGVSGITMLSNRLKHLPLADIDPTTIFVGGLRAEDSEVWDEQKLRSIFNTYGIVENVQIVKPPAATWFAFVKFAGAESALRAVREEHNRIHYGRPLRVQLRDRNPHPRSDWRSGRGKSRTHFQGPLRLGQTVPDEGSFNPRDMQDMSAHSIRTPNHSQAPATGGIDVFPGPSFARAELHRRSSQGISESSASSVSSSSTKVPSAHAHSPLGPSSAITPPPVVADSVAPPGAPPPPLSIGMSYLPSQPWVQPYHPAYSYPMPMVPGYAYPGYAYPQIPPVPPPTVAREASVITSLSSGGPPSGSGSSHETKAASSDERESRSPPQNALQPPLRPTGFIQNEQGTLIPVYQREALDQYMAGTHSGPPSHSSQPSSHNHPAPVSLAAPWPNPPFPVYGGPYPAVGHHMAPCPPPVHGPCWYPSGGPYPASAAQHTPSQDVSIQVSSTGAPISGTTPAIHSATHLHAWQGRPMSGQRGGVHHRRPNGRDYGFSRRTSPAHGSDNSVRFSDRSGSGPRPFGRT
ncbi:hypothetical protein C8Q77DRAFT_72376 [Trametes polyzona]|nr:hypothetical protein C8Q77DRAFT_72376 [Trametes polyzona]